MKLQKPSITFFLKYFFSITRYIKKTKFASVNNIKDDIQKCFLNYQKIKKHFTDVFLLLITRQSLNLKHQYLKNFFQQARLKILELSITQHCQNLDQRWVHTVTITMTVLPYFSTTWKSVIFPLWTEEIKDTLEVKFFTTCVHLLVNLIL